MEFGQTIHKRTSNRKLTIDKERAATAHLNWPDQIIKTEMDVV